MEWHCSKGFAEASISFRGTDTNAFQKLVKKKYWPVASDVWIVTQTRTVQSVAWATPEVT